MLAFTCLIYLYVGFYMFHLPVCWVPHCLIYMYDYVLQAYFTCMTTLFDLPVVWVHMYNLPACSISYV